MTKLYEYKDDILELHEKHKLMGEIYLITNVKNNKIYIGQTVSHRKNKGKYRPFGSIGRFNDHVSEAICNTKHKQCSYLNNAIRKYGREKFKWELIEYCPLDKMNENEEFWIVFYKSLFPNGYNLTKGGKTFTVASIQRPTLNKKKIRGRGFGFKHKTETIDKMKKNHNFVKNPEVVRNTMRKTMNDYYDNLKIQKLALLELDDDIEKYVRPVYKKDTGELYNYIIRINRNLKFTMATPGQLPEDAKNRLLNALHKAKEIRKANATENDIVLTNSN